jgi:hypothetical protein|tara:strand:- start:24 stop:752 length:729 start_codon:yes stop_codon:yes gene_type:complete
MSEFTTPTEKVELPSKGLVYPKESPLSSGVIEMKYMTAKEEDILMNQSYIKKGTAIDKLLKSLIVTEIDYDDMIVGDKNAVMVAARVLGYGPDYSFDYEGEEHTVDLGQIDNKPFDDSTITPGLNEFTFTLPHSKIDITYKLLTNKDEKLITRELEGLKRLNKNNSPEMSTRMKYIITSVDGDRETKTIREFVDKRLLARDSKSLRNHIKNFQPDVDLTFFPTSDSDGVNIPIRISFFWPDN